MVEQVRSGSGPLPVVGRRRGDGGQHGHRLLEAIGTMAFGGDIDRYLAGEAELARGWVVATVDLLGSPLARCFPNAGTVTLTVVVPILQVRAQAGTTPVRGAVTARLAGRSRI